MVPPIVLINKPTFTKTSSDWIYSYLTQRQQQVISLGKKSDSIITSTVSLEVGLAVHGDNYEI
jgi:hypothetical protein